jgi:hypothetical protein
MDKLDAMKSKWKDQGGKEKNAQPHNDLSLKQLIGDRVRKHTGTTMRYFWPVFVCQLIVYAVLSNVVIRYWSDTKLLVAGVAGIGLFIPFTWVLMKKFKAMASLRVGHRGITTMQEYVIQQRNLIQSFFQFKRWYELFLIPIATLIGVWITFEIFVPGGIMSSLNGAAICYVITLVSCAVAIVRENKRNFIEPLQELQEILNDFSVSSANQQSS